VWTNFSGMIKSLETKDIITLIIAAWGACLSTFVYLQSVWKERRHVVVIRSPAFFAYPDGNVGTQQTQIEVVNHGHRPVVVSAPTIRLPNKKHMNLVGAKGAMDFPKRLEDGESASLYIGDADITRALKRAGYSGVVALWPTCTDKTGNRYWGKKREFGTED
jgi:hypothetical protein